MPSAVPADAVRLTLSAGTHTYTIYAEKYNSYTWTNYTVHLNFDLAQAPQISAMAPLNVSSTQFFPPFQAYSEFTEDLAGRSVKTLNTLVYKSGQTEVKLVGFHFSNPALFNKDRVSPFQICSTSKTASTSPLRHNGTAISPNIVSGRSALSEEARRNRSRSCTISARRSASGRPSRMN